MALFEKPVKTLLNSYIHEAAKQAGAPEEYRRHVKLADAFNLIPKSAKPESLHNIPDSDGWLTFRRIPKLTLDKLAKYREELMSNITIPVPDGIEFQEWSITLTTGITASPDALSQFGEDADRVKAMITDAYITAGVLFQAIKKSNSVLETIDLKSVPEDLTLKVTDSRLPNFEFPLRITFQVNLL